MYPYEKNIFLAFEHWYAALALNTEQYNAIMDVGFEGTAGKAIWVLKQI